MSNAEIMTAYRQAHGLPEDAALYTASVWYNMGYVIKKGMKCEHRITLKAKSGRGFFDRRYAMFTADQVEKRQ